MTGFEEKRAAILSYRKLRSRLGEIHPAGRRLRILFDDDFEELYAEMETRDPLKFPGYRDKLDAGARKTGSKDSLICGIGEVEGIRCAAAELDPEFLMGSMGTVVGEKLSLLAEEAGRQHLPLVVFAASGGARMQEGMFSLMQMAKTSAAIQLYKKSGGLFISFLTNPTTGGVSASFAFLGDIILAEPGALIGFAGPRVIEKTIGEKLPEGFQRSEFQMEHGFIDRIVPEERMKSEIAALLRMHGYRAGGTEEKRPQNEITENVRRESEKDVPAGNYIKKDPWESVLRIREVTRPKVGDYIDGIFDGFIELKGDRLGREDPAICGGLAYLNGMPVTVIGHRKGKNLNENIACNFGMPGPEGYRKALRLMRAASKFGRPIITWIDTPGAYPGKEAEENGQSIAIAENLAAMSELEVPVVAVVTGEGSSGGALGIGVADEVWMLENAVYSVLSPEGFATILWKDVSRTKEACRVMRMTAAELYEDGIADRVIPEPAEGLSEGFDAFCSRMKKELTEKIAELGKIGPDELVKRRYRKYRGIV